MSLLDNLDSALDGGGDEKVPSQKGKEIAKDNKEEEQEVHEEAEDDTGGGEEKPKSTDVEDEEEEESDDDEVEPEKRQAKEPSKITAINKEFPELFKKHPELKEAYFKFEQYRQVFGTPEEAAEAGEKSELLNSLATELQTGNAEPLLDLLYETDPEGLKAFVGNFMPILNKKSPALFKMVFNPLFKNVLAKVARDAEENGDEDLTTSVKLISRAIFGKAEVPESTRIVPVIKKNEELMEERGKLAEQRETLFYENCVELVDPVLDKAINEGLDPDNVLSEGMREDTIEKIRRKTYEALRNNPSHMRTMLALRRSAAANGYSKEWQKKISKAVTNAAKEIMPSIRAKEKKRLFGNMFDKNKEINPSVPTSDGKPPVIGGEKKGTVPVDLKKMSIREALDQV